MMAKVRFNVSAATKNLSSSINKSVRDSNLEKEIGEFLVDRVKFQARIGKPLNDNGRFPELEESTKKRRRKLATLNRTDRSFQNRTSNLTFTGQLQNALDFKRSTKNIFELFIKNTRRRPIRGVNGLIKDAKTNQAVDDKLRKGVGRKKKKFILFSTKGLKKSRIILKRIRQLYVRSLRRQLRRS